jgi:hypothetical protein
VRNAVDVRGALPRLAPTASSSSTTSCGGAVVDPAKTDESTVAIRELNDVVAADPRVEAVMLPVADGITVVRRR